LTLSWIRFTKRYRPNSPLSENGPEKRGLLFQVTGSARRDIAAIVKRSLPEFGEAASLRYRTLIRQALLDLEADPERSRIDKTFGYHDRRPSDALS
jgi:hypothetical protein